MAREIGAFAVWVPVAVAFAMGYLTFITKVLGFRLGLEGGAYLVVLPLALLFFAGAVWLPFFIWRRRSTGLRLSLAGAAAGAGLAGVATFPFCGTSCFDATGSDAFLGEAGMIAAFVGALAHDRLSGAHMATRSGLS